MAAGTSPAARHRGGREVLRFAVAAFLVLALGVVVAVTALRARNGVGRSWRLPGQPPGRLYSVRLPAGAPDGASSSGGDTTSFSLPVFEALRQDRRDFSDVMAFAPLGDDKVTVQVGDVSEEATGEMVSGNFFSGLGVRMELGGRFKMEDERLHIPFVVLSLNYWTHLYSRNPGVLGQAIYIRGVPFAILGVTAEGFSGVEPGRPTDFWIPLQSHPELNPWGSSRTLYGSPNWWCLRLIARLAPGVDAQRALTEATPRFHAAAYASLGAPALDHPKVTLALVPAMGIGGLSDGPSRRTPVMLALAALLLLIACGYLAMRIRTWRGKRRASSVPAS
jgi:MacB-like periplasmic core domain